jgi:hypothetical protein
MPAMHCKDCDCHWYAMNFTPEGCLDCGSTNLEPDTSDPNDRCDICGAPVDPRADACAQCG